MPSFAECSHERTRGWDRFRDCRRFVTVMSCDHELLGRVEAIAENFRLFFHGKMIPMAGGPIHVFVGLAKRIRM